MGALVEPFLLHFLLIIFNYVSIFPVKHYLFLQVSYRFQDIIVLLTTLFHYDSKCCLEYMGFLCVPNLQHHTSSDASVSSVMNSLEYKCLLQSLFDAENQKLLRKGAYDVSKSFHVLHELERI